VEDEGRDEVCGASAAGIRDAAINIARRGSAVGASMNLQVNVFAVKIARVHRVRGALATVTAEHRGPALLPAAGGVANGPVILRTANDDAGVGVSACTVKLG